MQEEWSFSRLETWVLLKLVKQNGKDTPERLAVETNDVVSQMEKVIKRHLTPSEAHHLLFTFSLQAVLLSRGQLPEREVHALALKIATMVKTATRMFLQSDYRFDSLVPMAVAQSGTVLQYVVKGTSLYCAKIAPLGPAHCLPNYPSRTFRPGNNRSSVTTIAFPPVPVGRQPPYPRSP
jgi:hypothetical protein